MTRKELVDRLERIKDGMEIILQQTQVFLILRTTGGNLSK